MSKLYQDKDWLEDQYINQKKSIGKIAIDSGKGYGTIWRLLNKNNIERRSISEALKGKNHGQWKGDNVGYNALHTWIKTYKPKPEVCEVCGEHEKLELSNKTGKLIRNIDNFQYVCRKCHSKYDKENNIKHKGRKND